MKYKKCSFAVFFCFQILSLGSSLYGFCGTPERLSKTQLFLSSYYSLSKNIIVGEGLKTTKRSPAISEHFLKQKNLVLDHSKTMRNLLGDMVLRAYILEENQVEKYAEKALYISPSPDKLELFAQMRKDYEEKTIKFRDDYVVLWRELHQNAKDLLQDLKKLRDADRDLGRWHFWKTYKKIDRMIKRIEKMQNNFNQARLGD